MTRLTWEAPDEKYEGHHTARTTAWIEPFHYRANRILSKGGWTLRDSDEELMFGHSERRWYATKQEAMKAAEELEAAWLEEAATLPHISLTDDEADA